MISDLSPKQYKSLQIKAKRYVSALSGNFLSSLHGEEYDFPRSNRLNRNTYLYLGLIIISIQR